MVCENMQKSLHGFFSDNRNDSPHDLEEKHREEARKIEFKNFIRMQHSLDNTPGVLSFRKAQRMGST
jgi:hypothetical protein